MKYIDIISLIQWHDGVLLEVKITSKNGMNIILTLEVYESQASKIRKKIKVNFIKVEDLVFSVDSNELMDNYKAGNVSNAYIKPCQDIAGRYKFFLYLVDGLMSLHFNGLVVE